MGAMTEAELIEEGMTPEEAKREMDRRVFGFNVTYDRSGRPVERGRGSAAQPTEQHLAALEKAEGAAAANAARAAAEKRRPA
jgi:hypothetical protein